MVELELLQTASYLIAALSFTITCAYYIMNLKNTQKNMQMTLETRQTQLFMQLFAQYNTKDFMNDFGKVAYQMEYKDLADWEKKYTPTNSLEHWASWGRVGRFFDGVGILVKRRLIDLDLVVEELREIILYSWDKMSPWVYEVRSVMKSERTWENFEFLAVEARKKHSDVASLDEVNKWMREAAKEVK